MASNIGLIEVPAGSVEVVRPPREETWKVTALVSKGTDFAVRFSNGSKYTNRILVDNFVLSAEIYIDKDTYIWFHNSSKRVVTGFYCAQVIT